MKEAYLYTKLENKDVRCKLCSHECLIRSGKRGLCGVRENRDGTLVTLVYDKVIARHVDPIEKKPMFHFLPGTRSYSIATPGCNMRCSFCQNSDISQMPVEQNTIIGENVPPAELVRDALSAGALTIAYTYTEPTIFYELAVDTARLAAEKGLRNIFVSNGFMSQECLEDIGRDLHGANIDLKAFSNDFYKKQCGARLEPVLKTIAELVRRGVWVEVTTLLIPGLNDSDQELRDMAGFLFDTSPDIPWHISRFHPTYKLMDIGPTPFESLRRAREIGYETGLKYVYTGNVPGEDGENSYCHKCGRTVIERYGFSVVRNTVKNGKCPYCETEIPGVWE